MKRVLCLLFLFAAMLVSALPVEAGCKGRARGEHKLLHRVTHPLEKFRERRDERAGPQSAPGTANVSGCADGSCGNGRRIGRRR